MEEIKAEPEMAKASRFQKKRAWVKRGEKIGLVAGEVLGLGLALALFYGYLLDEEAYLLVFIAIWWGTSLSIYTFGGWLAGTLFDKKNPETILATEDKESAGCSPQNA